MQCGLPPYCPPLSRKRGDIKSHSSVPLSVCHKKTLAITFALLQVQLWYLPCVFVVTRPFRWYHVMTLTVTFNLLQGKICCRAGDHNSLNLLPSGGPQFSEFVAEWGSQFSEIQFACSSYSVEPVDEEYEMEAGEESDPDLLDDVDDDSHDDDDASFVSVQSILCYG